MEKARACKSSKELIALAGEVGVKLTDEELTAVAGGGVDWSASLCKEDECYNNF